MSIFSFIGTLFGDLFSATRRAWNHLPSSIQTQIKNGSGIMSILSQYIGQDPNQTIATLQANYSVDYDTLAVLAKYWGLTVPATLPDLVVTLQNYIKGIQGSEWDRILSTGAQVLADVLTGSSTPFGIIATVIEFVYNEFIKSTPITLVAPVAPAVTPSSGSISVTNAVNTSATTAVASA